MLRICLLTAGLLCSLYEPPFCLAERSDLTIIDEQRRSPHQSPTTEPMVWSGALSLHFEIPELGLTYQRALQDAKRLGLTHVALVAQAALRDVYSDEVSLSHDHATPLETVRRVALSARAQGLDVIIFPIIWVEERATGEWRGTLRPRHPDRWWESYERWIQALAHIAAECGATHLSIGSELSSLERDEGRWRALIRRLRASFGGKLIYSANWDHYAAIRFWDALDMVGITGYYPLADPKTERDSLESVKTPTVASMTERWRWVRLMLTEWLDTLKPPASLMITELGYPSQRGGAARPWHYTQSTLIDLEVQRRAFMAFARGWVGERRLGGVNIWNLWGLGGAQDTWYTLRGKPAFGEVQSLITQMKTRAAIKSDEQRGETDE